MCLITRIYSILKLHSRKILILLLTVASCRQSTCSMCELVCVIQSKVNISGIYSYLSIVYKFLYHFNFDDIATNKMYPQHRLAMYTCKF